MAVVGGFPHALGLGVHTVRLPGAHCVSGEGQTSTLYIAWPTASANFRSVPKMGDHAIKIDGQ